MFGLKTDKQKWIESAINYTKSLTGPWEIEENLVDYCECLYADYYEGLDGEDQVGPEEAVDEDMSYWD